MLASRGQPNLLAEKRDAVASGSVIFSVSVTSKRGDANRDRVSLVCGCEGCGCEAVRAAGVRL
eukprot:7330000-Pyramimonas_sp.AAC.1